MPGEVDTDTLDTVLAHHRARSSPCLLIEPRRRTPQHRSTSAVAQQHRSEWTCHSGLIRLNNPAHFDPAQRRPGCCASAGPDREALAVSVCRVGVCCSGPGWVQCGEMPNSPRPAGLGCSTTQEHLPGFAAAQPPSTAASHLRWSTTQRHPPTLAAQPPRPQPATCGVQRRRGMCWGLRSGYCMVSFPRGPRVISAPRLEWISLWWQCPHSRQRLSRSVGPPSFQLQMWWGSQ